MHSTQIALTQTKLQHVVSNLALGVEEQETAVEGKVAGDAVPRMPETSAQLGESCLKCGGPNHFSSQRRMVDQNLNEMVNQGSSENEFFVDCPYIENTSFKDSSACFFCGEY